MIIIALQIRKIMGKKSSKEEKVIYFCNGKKCCRYNESAKSCFTDLIVESGACVVMEKMKCQGKCKNAPVFYIEHKDKYAKEVCPKKAKKIFEKHIA